MRKFAPGYWTHAKFMDVYVQVTAINYVGPNYTKMKVLWWNRNPHGKPFLISPFPQRVTIKKEHYDQWSRCEP